MKKSLLGLAAVAAVLVSAIATPAAAREGTTTQKKHGIKCYQTFVPQADGTLKLTQVCRKGV